MAVLASVFIHNGGYAGPHAFIHGLTPAVWVAVGLSAMGILAGVLTGGRRELRSDSVLVPAAPEAQAA